MIKPERWRGTKSGLSLEAVKNKGAVKGTEWRLITMGPESGIVDGESPSISLSYIDKTVYKHTYTCAYSVSTESVSHQLGPCLVAHYLSSTLPLKRAALKPQGVAGAAQHFRLSWDDWWRLLRSSSASAMNDASKP